MLKRDSRWRPELLGGRPFTSQLFFHFSHHPSLQPVHNSSSSLSFRHSNLTTDLLGQWRWKNVNTHFWLSQSVPTRSNLYTQQFSFSAKVKISDCSDPTGYHHCSTSHASSMAEFTMLRESRIEATHQPGMFLVF